VDTNKTTIAFSALSKQMRHDVFRLLIKAGKKGMLSDEIGEAVDQNSARL